MNTEIPAELPPDIDAAITHLINQARSAQQRALLVLSGSQEWGLLLADRLVSGCASVINIGASSRGAIPAGKVKHLLGRECSVVVFDAHEGCHPDALAAIGGLVMAGGLLILLTPNWEDWPHVADPDYQRLASYPHDWRCLPHRYISHMQQSVEMAKLASACLHLREAVCGGWSSVAKLEWPDPPRNEQDHHPLPEQQRCLETLSELKGVAVLMAARGRGKSALLGFVARNLMQRGQKVVLVAPSRASAVSVFRHSGKKLVFSAPDMLLQDKEMTADLLLIDEAASMPLPMLWSVLERFPNVVLATTTEGYEGTGQGFLLRFLRELSARYPAWQRLALLQPVRWAAHDPLEAWLYKTLLLDAEESDLKGALNAESIDQTGIIFERISQLALLENPVLLADIYGLLRSAHYRTTPDDLRFLLDAPGLSVYRLHSAGISLAVAMVVEEGSLDSEMAGEIAAGRRRPRGHLLVQTLAIHSGQAQYLRQRVARVVRIAVHTKYQQRGLGSQLLQQLTEDQSSQGVKAVGSSFSATPEVLAFWRKNGFELLRVGHRRQAASAAPSALVLKLIED